MPVPQHSILLWNGHLARTTLKNGQDARSTQLNFIVERASCPFLNR
ncbi:hypothetical protein QUA00_04510 [Microcoleus sp. T2B6]